MSESLTKDYVFMHVASTIALLGTCDRASVGAVITRNGRCISWGFNGAPPGMPHCDENDHGWDGETVDKSLAGERALILRRSEVEGCRNATHAEANALAFAAKQGISTEGATLYVTVSPCPACARLIIAAGIERVVWRTTYRDPAGSELLQRACIRRDVLIPHVDFPQGQMPSAVARVLI